MKSNPLIIKTQKGPTKLTLILLHFLQKSLYLFHGIVSGADILAGTSVENITKEYVLCGEVRCGRKTDNQLHKQRIYMKSLNLKAPTKSLWEFLDNRIESIPVNIPEGPTIITPNDVEALRRGNHTAYDKIYMAYWDSIKNFLYKITRSQEEAKEITQDIFMNLWIKREQLDPSKKFKSYLFTIAKNSAYNRFNHKQVELKYQRLNHTETDFSTPPDEVLIAEEMELLTEIAISRMPKLRKQVYELSQQEMLSNEQIAQKLNISKENVANHLARAKRDLREILYLFIVLFILP